MRLASTFERMRNVLGKDALSRLAVNFSQLFFERDFERERWDSFEAEIE